MMIRYTLDWFIGHNYVQQNQIIIKMETIWLLFLINIAYGQVYLNNVPVTFALAGQLNYVPDTGGIAIPGYLFTIGFNRYSWIGVQFMQTTSASNYDTLVVQRTTTSNGGVYTCTISDYYISSGRPDTLMSDRITNMDRSNTTNSNSNYFEITIARTLGNTSGEDWTGGEMSEICFFTSDSTFSQNSWSKQYQACFGYQSYNFVSTFWGSYLGSMYFESVSSKVYGGIYGASQQLQLYWYRNNPTLPNTTNIIIQLGSQISSNVGYDYYQCGVGDYFGGSANNIQNDLSYSGYSNGECAYQKLPNSYILSYSRDINTYDDFDFQLTSTFPICLVGNSNGCGTIAPPILYPSMTITSALQTSQISLQIFLMLTGLFCLIIVS